MLTEDKILKLQALANIVSKETKHLEQTTGRLFVQEDWDWIYRIEHDIDLAERVDAFVGRFGRLQDTLGDKLIPLLLNTAGNILLFLQGKHYIRHVS